MLAYKLNSREIVNQIFIPKYYDPELKQDLSALEASHSLLSLGDLLDAGDITVQTGHEIGKMASISKITSFVNAQRKKH